MQVARELLHEHDDDADLGDVDGANLVEIPHWGYHPNTNDGRRVSNHLLEVLEVEIPAIASVKRLHLK